MGAQDEGPKGHNYMNSSWLYKYLVSMVAPGG